MMAGGLILMAVMMGAMFLLGGHGKGHKHTTASPPEVTVSSGTVVSTAAVQNTEQPEAGQDAEHRH